MSQELCKFLLSKESYRKYEREKLVVIPLDREDGLTLSFMNDKKFIETAIQHSKKSVEIGGFPVGAVVTNEREVIATGVSNGKQVNDPTSHAEIAAIREACKKLNTRDPENLTVYSSLEPCLMCLSACFWASIDVIKYAASRERVSPQHFEGGHNIEKINSSFRDPLQLTHLSNYEKEALSVIELWEAS